MRILHVTLGFHPAYAWGGPVKIVRQNGGELVRRGHQVSVYCTNLLDKRHRLWPGTKERDVDGMRVVYLNTWHFPWWPGTVGPFWSPDLPEYLNRELSGFDVVHLNGYRSPMMLSVARAAHHLAIPVILQPHGTLPVSVSSVWAKRVYDVLLGRFELQGISALIAGQETERQQAVDCGVPAERIDIIPNGIDPGERTLAPPAGSFRRRTGLAPDRPLILFLGRINKKKGTDMLIEAFAQMRNKDAQLAIVGPDDGQLAEVRHLIQKRNLGHRVVLPGLLSGPDVLGAFRDADLFVLPCRVDTFPFAIVEACLMGTPMVISERCEMADIVRDKVADIVPFDAYDFAEAMDRLLLDRESRARFQSNCAAMIRDRFSIAAVVDRLEALYARVVRERKASSCSVNHG
jgi:glycosyltransferase involved in cell wall biosynthesis